VAVKTRLIGVATEKKSFGPQILGGILGVGEASNIRLDRSLHLACNHALVK